MKELILEYLERDPGTLGVEALIVNFIVALILGMIVYLSYKFSHSRAVYSGKFNVSLVMLTIISTMVMSVIGNNIALSLGMVGALSIVRFRTAIKDPRDTIYIFWAIVIGICCGSNEFLTAIVGSIVVFIFLLVFGVIKGNERYLLVIHSNYMSEEKVDDGILLVYKGNARLKVKNRTADKLEYIYEISQKMIDKSKINPTKYFYDIEGVYGVNLVNQNEEISK